MNTTMGAVAAPKGGCLCLPSVDPEIPGCFGRDRDRARTLARFCQAAVRAGLPLPVGDFTSIDHVVAAQWNQHLASAYPIGTSDVLAGAPVIEIDDDALRFVVYAQSSLNAYRLKPVVEALEAQARGLGWFVQSVLAAAGSHALQIYDMGMATSMLEVFHSGLEEFTDEGYARAILLANGESPPAAGKPIDQQTINELREQYGFWPSALLAEVGGHAHLLQHWQPRPTKRPKVMSARAAARWLRNHPGHPQAETVEAALGLQRALARDRDRAFVWDGDRDETEPLGAMCFLTWDEPQLLFEAVQHHEENQYNGGQAVEAFARRTLPLAEADDAQLRALARRIANYLYCWCLLAQLLSHFPIWEEGDDAA